MSKEIFKINSFYEEGKKIMLHENHNTKNITEKNIPNFIIQITIGVTFLGDWELGLAYCYLKPPLKDT